MTLADNIRKARKAKGWSQRTLGEKIESDTSYINRIETGKLNPSIAALIRIADALERTLDQLVKDGDEAADVHIRDKSLTERMRLIDALEETDRNMLIHMMDTMLTKQRMKELIVGKEST
ncbi:MAG: helix-turn-helix domain-containing protein [Desulfosalsimonadaceae bacterium]